MLRTQRTLVLWAQQVSCLSVRLACPLLERLSLELERAINSSHNGYLGIAITFAFAGFIKFELVVCMVWIGGIKKTELWIMFFFFTNTIFKLLWFIRKKLGSLVDGFCLKCKTTCFNDSMLQITTYLECWVEGK